MTETGVVKSCVACGKNLNGQKRMKDSQGRYWCIECGTEDQKKKMAASGVGANACSSCGQTFPPHQLSAWGSRRLCPGCSPSSKGPGMMATITGIFSSLGSGGGGGSDKKKLIMMGIVMALLAAIALYVNLS
jgi:hypothetical protein